MIEPTWRIVKRILIKRIRNSFPSFSKRKLNELVRMALLTNTISQDVYTYVEHTLKQAFFEKIKRDFEKYFEKKSIIISKISKGQYFVKFENLKGVRVEAESKWHAEAEVMLTKLDEIGALRHYYSPNIRKLIRLFFNRLLKKVGIKR